MSRAKIEALYRRHKWKEKNCYEDGLEFLWKLGREKLGTKARLCHGVLALVDSEIDFRYVHCWVEVGIGRSSFACDCRNALTPTSEYLATNKASRVERYTVEAASKLFIDRDSYGPFDADLAFMQNFGGLAPETVAGFPAEVRELLDRFGVKIPKKTKKRA